MVASTLPLLLTLGFYKITGKGTNDVRAVKYIRDIVLIAYTIIVSLLAMVLDEEKNLGGRTRAFLCYLAFCFYMRGVYIDEYNKGLRLISEEKYDQARDLFVKLGDYKDSIEKVEEAQNYLDYKEADQLIKDCKYEEAWEIFDNLGAFLDSENRAKEARYIYAVELYNNGKKRQLFTVLLDEMI